MSAESTASSGVPHDNRFKVWRQTRPFWAGLFTMIGGVPIAYLPYGDMRLGNVTLAMKTTAGAGALIIGVLLITLGLTMWFQPLVRVFAGVAAIVLGLVSIPVSNFG
ncbi:membrane protein, partial [Streptomyces platensis subsp. clarensis]|nr:membrane protein [Streptomyces platensis subsp. clarensis]